MMQQLLRQSGARKKKQQQQLDSLALFLLCKLKQTALPRQIFEQATAAESSLILLSKPRNLIRNMSSN